MSAKILQINCLTTNRIEPDKVLEEQKGAFDEVFVIGIDAEGNYAYASSTSDLTKLLWLCEQAKRFLLDKGDE